MGLRKEVRTLFYVNDSGVKCNDPISEKCIYGQLFGILGFYTLLVLLQFISKKDGQCHIDKKPKHESCDLKQESCDLITKNKSDRVFYSISILILALHVNR